jgi:hypothetical protein
MAKGDTANCILPTAEQWNSGMNGANGAWTNFMDHVNTWAHSVGIPQEGTTEEEES